jgi:hypothetical protein
MEVTGVATKSLKSGLLAACLLLAFGCGGGGGSGGSEEPGGEPETSGGEGEEGGGGGDYQGPITSTEVDRGKEVFATYCDDCHPGGEEDVGPSLIADPHSPADLRRQVREGSGKMRPFPEKRINSEDLEALLAYLASINAVK